MKRYNRHIVNPVVAVNSRVTWEVVLRIGTAVLVGLIMAFQFVKLVEAQEHIQYLEKRLAVAERVYVRGMAEQQARLLQQHPLHERYEELFDRKRRGMIQQVAAEYMLRQNPRLDYQTSQEIAEALVVCSRGVGVDPWWGLAIMQQESWFYPRAVGPTGERGLMQLTRTVARQYGVDWDDEVWDIKTNVCTGLAYFARHWRERGSVESALLRYNGSPQYIGVVKRRYYAVQRFIHAEGVRYDQV